MGLHTGQQKTYLKIKDGKFYRSSDKENKEPYNSLTGIIKGFRFKDDEYNGNKFEKLEVDVISGEDLFSFSTITDSSYFSTFLNFLGSVDISKEIEIVPKLQEEGGKKRTSILVGQGGVYKAKYTKASPGDLPQLKKVTFKGKDAWDNTEQLAFWKKVIAEKYSNLTAAPASDSKTDLPKEAEPAHAPEDDLPF